MPKLLNGDGSEYEFAAGMLATRARHPVHAELP